MDEARAKRIATELKDKQVSSWTAQEYIGYGKSAVILRAKRGSEEAALKIFDPDLVERFGREAQLKRIKRETDLIGQRHPYLIEIKDGGECFMTGYLFVAMAFLPQKNLLLVLNSIPREKIFSIINQVASAAKFLEDKGLAHRDIKPENICISHDFTHATLLDLGVLKPIGLSDVTDVNDQKIFVSTLRYSPPELLYREEESDTAGWRNITFYQLGAVLHDMIMRRVLFHPYGEPYARLVDAVKEEVPEISATDVDGWLVSLAQSCLVKAADIRGTLVSWDNFFNKPDTDALGEDLRQRITKKKLIAEGNLNKNVNEYEKGIKYRRALEFESILDSIKASIRAFCLDEDDYFPPFELIKSEKLDNETATIMVCFRPSKKHGIDVALTLVLYVHELNSPETILDLGFFAVASENCPIEYKECQLVPQTFYKGPYETSVLGRRIQNLMLSLIDIGQDLGKANFSNEKAGSLSNAIQLELAI